MKMGTLYIVATPIGNLSDMTFRAVEILKSVTLIAAEDTRHSKKLLSHYSIHTPTISLHEHNEQQRIETLKTRLLAGHDIALISDAGTPLISDPGYRLVNDMHQFEVNVVPIPGACAAIAALSAAGLPTDRFAFEGFLPVKKNAREQRLKMLVNESRTIIFYESRHRILSFLDVLLDHFGPDRMTVIARELTKTFETIRQAPLKDLIRWMRDNPNQQKGEFVVLLQGETSQSMDEKQSEYHRILEVLLNEMSLKQAVAITSKLTQGHHRQIYQLALQIKKQV